MVNERKADFNFYLNQQGARGRKGEKGDQGFSPIVTEYESTATSYRLQIENLDGTFITPNLLPAIQDAGGTVLQFDREQQKYFLGDLPTATEDTPGLITTASENDLTNLSEIGAVSPIGVFTIAGNVIEPGSDNVQIVVDGDANKIKIAVSQERFELPIATPTTLGGIKPDNQTIVVDPVTGETHANFDEIGNALNALSNKVNKIDEDVLTLDGLLIDTQGDVEVLQDKSTELDGRVSALEERELPEDVFTKENLKGGTNVTLRQVGNETYIDAVGGGQPVDAYTREETDELLEAKAFVADVYDKDETYNKGEVDGLIAGVTPKVDNVTIEVNTEGKLQTTVDINDVQNRVEDVEEKIADLQLYKFPNATIVGEPTINNGQISNFSTTNYLKFPFEFETKGRTWILRGSFDTDADVSVQQNLIDSLASVAMAVRNGRLVLALSSNGTSFNLGEHLSMSDILPSTKYYFRLSFSGTQYLLTLSTDKQEWLPEAVVTSTEPIASRPMTISSPGHPYKGVLNLNDWDLTVGDVFVWQGMDDVGIASRMDVNMSNMTETAKQTIRDLAVTGNPLLAELPLVKTTETKDSLAQGLNIEDGQVVGNYHICYPSSSNTFNFSNGAGIEHGTTALGEYLNHDSYIEVPLERNTIFYLPFVNNSQATDKGAGWTVMVGTKDATGNFYPKAISLWNIFSYVATDINSLTLLEDGNLQGSDYQQSTYTSNYVSDFKRQAFCVTSDNNLQMLNCSYSGQYRSATADLRTAYLNGYINDATHLRFVPFESNGIIGTDFVKKDTSGTDLQTMLNNGTMVYLEAENNAVPVHGEVIVTDKLSLKVDGTTVVVNEHGELSATAEPVPVATADTVGTVKPDNNTITIDEDGTLHAQGGGGGGYTIGDGLALKNNVLSVAQQGDDTINYTVIGTPTISSDYVASNFSDDNYLTYLCPLNGTEDTWEMIVPILSTDNSISNAGIIDSKRETNNNIRFTLNEGKPKFRTTSSLSTQTYLVDLTASSPIQLNTKTYIKVEYDSQTGYKLSSSLNKKDWNVLSTSSDTTKILYTDNLLWYIGDNIATGNSFKGNIYLDEVEITRNNSEVKRLIEHPIGTPAKATDKLYGVVRPDNDTLTVTEGVLSSNIIDNKQLLDNKTYSSNKIKTLLDNKENTLTDNQPIVKTVTKISPINNGSVTGGVLSFNGTPRSGGSTVYFDDLTSYGGTSSYGNFYLNHKYYVEFEIKPGDFYFAPDKGANVRSGWFKYLGKKDKDGNFYPLYITTSNESYTYFIKKVTGYTYSSTYYNISTQSVTQSPNMTTDLTYGIRGTMFGFGLDNSLGSEVYDYYSGSDHIGAAYSNSSVDLSEVTHIRFVPNSSFTSRTLSENNTFKVIRNVQSSPGSAKRIYDLYNSAETIDLESYETIITEIGLSYDDTLTVNAEGKLAQANNPWVYNYLTVCSNLAVETGTVNTHDISAYLPNDGHVYEVLGRATVQGSTTTNCRVFGKTDVINNDYAYALGFGTSTHQGSGNMTFVVGTGRSITTKCETAAGTYTLVLTGYRRVI